MYTNSKCPQYIPIYHQLPVHGPLENLLVFCTSGSHSPPQIQPYLLNKLFESLKFFWLLQKIP